MDLVVVTSHWKENLSWLKKSRWPVVLVDHKGSARPEIPSSYIIPNKGREASSYLKFIVENYEELPKYMAFIHGHEFAWHHKYKTPLLNIIEHRDYLPLNGFWTDTKTHHDKIKKHWHLIEPWVGPMPTEHGSLDGSAQFVVSRNRVLRHSKQAYKTWYSHIISSDDHYNIGIMFEYTWHYIFGEPWIMHPFTPRRVFLGM